MSLLTYDQFMLPLLKLAAEDGQVHPIAALRETLAQRLDITPEQRTIKLPSGRQSIFDNRMGWASTYLRKAWLLSRPKRGYVQITQRGRELLAENSPAIDDLYLQCFGSETKMKHSRPICDLLMMYGVALVECGHSSAPVLQPFASFVPCWVFCQVAT